METLIDNIDRKAAFIASLKANYGIIALACEDVGINRRQYYDWRATDALFSEECDEISEIQGDFVESKLMTLIDAGDTAAVTFYCKTKLAGRGYSAKQLALPDIAPELQGQTIISVPAVQPEQVRSNRDELMKPVNQWRSYIRRLLNADGSYKPKYTYQLTLAAQSLKLLQDCYLAILNQEGDSFTMTEISREGNSRMSEKPLVSMYIKLDAMCRKNLAALGMNMNKLIEGIEASEKSDPLRELMEKMK